MAEEFLTNYLTHRVSRYRRDKANNDELYNGREKELTFHAGYTAGYTEGRLAALEDLADVLGIKID